MALGAGEIGLGRLPRRFHRQRPLRQVLRHKNPIMQSHERPGMVRFFPLFINLLMALPATRRIIFRDQLRKRINRRSGLPGSPQRLSKSLQQQKDHNCQSGSAPLSLHVSFSLQFSGRPSYSAHLTRKSIPRGGNFCSNASCTDARSDFRSPRSEGLKRRRGSDRCLGLACRIQSKALELDTVTWNTVIAGNCFSTGTPLLDSPDSYSTIRPCPYPCLGRVRPCPCLCRVRPCRRPAP